MSFSAQPRGLQRYSSETATQKQGKLIKQLIDEVHRQIKSIKSKKYTNSDFLQLDNRLNELKISLKSLESINPNSQHENFEKKEFLQHFKKEMDKINIAINGFKPPVFEKSIIEKEIEREEHLKVEIYEDELIEKANALKEVQSNIYELKSMFSDLASTVDEQGQMLDTVDNFVEISAVSTKSANEELDKASTYQKKQRCCVLVAIPAFLALLLILIFLFT